MANGEQIKICARPKSRKHSRFPLKLLVGLFTVATLGNAWNSNIQNSNIKKSNIRKLDNIKSANESLGIMESKPYDISTTSNLYI